MGVAPKQKIQSFFKIPFSEVPASSQLVRRVSKAYTLETQTTNQ